jgi:hypothetical protein
MHKKPEVNIPLLIALTHNIMTGQTTGTLSNLIDNMNPGREMPRHAQPPMHKDFHVNSRALGASKRHHVRQPGGKQTCGHF